MLYVGGISPHKNIAALIEAFAVLHQQHPQYRLALAGDVSGDVFHSAYKDLQRLIAARRLDGAAVFTGYVSDNELVQLYNAATVFVLPSLMEGFGLPAIEAMACGTPVIASARGALPEVVGAAGVLFDPAHPGELEAALQRLVQQPELRERLRHAGPARAAQFSWDARGARHRRGAAPLDGARDTGH